tara:strand:- start:1423 stop:2373 length:951 start_codon:yes stop_codon:yes gene_type:complete
MIGHNMDINNKKSQLKVALWTLFGTSICISLTTNLAKVANINGLQPMPFMLWSLCLSAIALILNMLIKQEKMPKAMNALRYYFWSAVWSVTLPNLILFFGVPKVGVSFVALTMCLPPLLTYLGALMMGLERVSAWRIGGVAFALTGAFILVAAQWKLNVSNQLWLVITLLGPVFLAMGNIYRTLHWPAGSKPEALAPGMILFGSIMLLAFGAIHADTSIQFELSKTHIGLILLQGLVFTAQYLLLFILQKAGGPVFLSLIGTISAAISVPVATILLGEPLLKALAPSALLMLIGLLMMIKGQNAQRSNTALSQSEA